MKVVIIDGELYLKPTSFFSDRFIEIAEYQHYLNIRQKELCENFI